MGLLLLCCVCNEYGAGVQIQWHGSDEEGHPILLVHVARMCDDCQSAEHAQQAADAVISQACSDCALVLLCRSCCHMLTSSYPAGCQQQCRLVVVEALPRHQGIQQ